MGKDICTNRNKFILGLSDTGKWFFTNHVVRSYTRIILVDIGHSYKGLCDLVDGLLPDSLQNINHLLFYPDNRSLNEIIMPEGLEKKSASFLPYEKQVFILLLILLN